MADGSPTYQVEAVGSIEKNVAKNNTKLGEIVLAKVDVFQIGGNDLTVL
ncbi:MAG: hypothetical protein MUO52_06655 [Desulfobacterales bacterium]|nr:hypothetical protein [Desulfobacterales bacterium]